VSKASHELRTPLSSMRAYVEMLVDGEAEDEATRKEFYGIIQSETERLARLVDNMLNISRIEAGIVEIDRTRVDVGGVIKQAMRTIEPQAREKQQTLHMDLSPVDLHVQGDADMLLQVVVNLLSNAVKYTPDGGRITVAADSDNLARCVHVGVQDTGLGIPPADHERIFEKFYRVENYKRVAKGTGLGLNLCRHIVETVHGGQIGLESTLGMGSRFWFTVPMGCPETARLAA
jgi:two-component system phosphate regulon sensor histidine kinase PhoR